MVIHVTESSTKYLESTMRRLIPITRAMEITVSEYQRNRVVMKAPLAQNINHMGTAFGGSLNALGMLTGWAILHMLLKDQQIQARILIREGTASYLTPVEQDFEAICDVARESLLDQALEVLKRKGRATIELAAQIRCGGKVAMRFHGSFVMIADKMEAGE